MMLGSVSVTLTAAFFIEVGTQYILRDVEWTQRPLEIPVWMSGKSENFVDLLVK